MLPVRSFLPPDTVFHSRYRVVRPIKSGGMGTVYEVLDEKTMSRRALKVMQPNLVENETSRARFEREARVTGAIESDHLVRILDVGVDEGTSLHFLVMELLRGEDLGAVLERQNRLPVEDVLRYLGQAALALDKLHAAGITHRDLKPENLFLTFRDDGSPLIKILDFGIVKTQEPASPAVLTRGIVGTPMYMAPEQVQAARDIGPAADICALGHIAYDMLVGEPYWAEELEESGSPIMLGLSILDGPKEAPETRALRRKQYELPAGFDGWFATTTAKAPEERFQSAKATIAALTALVRESLRPAASLTSAELRPTTPTPVPSANPSDPPQDGEVRSRVELQDTTAAYTEPPRAIRQRLSPPPAAPSPPPSPPNEKRLAGQSNPTTGTRDEPAPSTTPISPRQMAKKGFLVAVDRTTRVVRADVWGFWDVKDGEAYWKEFEAKTAPLLGKPWYVLANISNFPPQRPEVSVFIEKTMTRARENGLVRAANIVSSALGRMQIQRLSAESGLPLFSFFQSDVDALHWLLTGKTK